MVDTMCGIVGYAGARLALALVLDGLRRLEYRGYDSAGVAVIADGVLLTCKRAGKLNNLEKALAEGAGGAEIGTGPTGIGHTRWATHGGPTDRNAHPHNSASGKVAVIHNGIIENFARLRSELESDGIEFVSDTDTESAAHLLEVALAQVRAEGGRSRGGEELAEAMRRVCQGRRRVHAARADADTPASWSARGATFAGGRPRQGRTSWPAMSRPSSAHPGSRRTGTGPGRRDHRGAIRSPISPATGRADLHRLGRPPRKGRHDYFAQGDRGAAGGGDTRAGGSAMVGAGRDPPDRAELRDVDKIFIVACGTAYHAGLVAKYAIEHWTASLARWSWPASPLPGQCSTGRRW
jgi:glucosamine--fructose-6-phosphate aminotransferase (isomerizing)